MLASVFCNKRGQTLVFFALLLPVLMGLTGLVVDVGTLYVEKARLQSSVDAAAAAGAMDLKTLSDHGTSEATARDFLQKNGTSTAAAAAAAVTYPAKPGDPAALLIRVSASEAVPTYFMKVLGFVSDVPVSASATAQATVGNGAFTYGIFSAKNLTINGGTTKEMKGDIYGALSVAVNGGVTIQGHAETAGVFKNAFNTTNGTSVLSSPLPLPTIDLVHNTLTPLTTDSISGGDYSSKGIMVLSPTKNNKKNEITLSGTLKGTFYAESANILLKGVQLDGLLYVKTGYINSEGSLSVVNGGLVAAGDITLNGGLTFSQQPTSIITQPAATKSTLIE